MGRASDGAQELGHHKRPSGARRHRALTVSWQVRRCFSYLSGFLAISTSWIWLVPS